MPALGHGEKNSQRAYLVSIASISGIPKCSRAGPSYATSGSRSSSCDRLVGGHEFIIYLKVTNAFSAG